MCWSHRLQRERATVGSAGRPDYQGGLRTLLHVSQAGAALDSPGTEPRSPLPPPCRPQAERSAAPQLVQQPGGPGPSPPTSSCLSPQLPREGTGQGSMWEQGFPSELLQAAAGGAQWPPLVSGPPGPRCRNSPIRHGCIIQASVGCPVSGPGSLPGIRQPGRGSWAGLVAGSAPPQH